MERKWVCVCVFVYTIYHDISAVGWKYAWGDLPVGLRLLQASFSVVILMGIGCSTYGVIFSTFTWPNESVVSCGYFLY